MLQNKKGYRNYTILDTLDTGIVLKGSEVKSLREGSANISDAYVKVINGELFLINADISRYKFTHDPSYDSTRTRKLLIHKSELVKLLSKSKQGSLTIIPLKVFFVRGNAKVQIGLAKGKKSYEKKAKEKERDLTREFHREKRKLMV